MTAIPERPPADAGLARTICPGKYIVLASGEVADVKAAVDAGAARAKEALVDEFVIPNIHPDVFPAIEGTAVVEETEALGIVETFSVASLIEAADAAILLISADFLTSDFIRNQEISRFLLLVLLTRHHPIMKRS